MSLNKTMFYLSCRGRGRREGGQQSLSRGMEGRMEEKNWRGDGGERSEGTRAARTKRKYVENDEEAK